MGRAQRNFPKSHSQVIAAPVLYKGRHCWPPLACLLLSAPASPPPDIIPNQCGKATARLKKKVAYVTLPRLTGKKSWEDPMTSLKEKENSKCKVFPKFRASFPKHIFRYFIGMAEHSHHQTLFFVLSFRLIGWGSAAGNGHAGQDCFCSGLETVSQQQFCVGALHIQCRWWFCIANKKWAHWRRRQMISSNSFLR